MLLGSDQGKLVAASSAGAAAVIAFAIWSFNSAMLSGDAATLEARLLDEKVAEFQRTPVQQMDLSRSPSIGNPDAPIKVVIYSDFLCPWCRSVAQLFEQNRPAWSDRVTVYYKYFPIDPLCNPYSKVRGRNGGCWAAIGGLCAQEQNKFWQYHDRIFRDPPRDPGPEEILRISQESGVDTSLAGPCFASTIMQSRIRDDIEEAQRLQLTGTPRIFINGKLLNGLSVLAPALKSEVTRLGLPPLEGIDD
jgi:protein-disulfide isomerase